MDPIVRLAGRGFVKNRSASPLPPDKKAAFDSTTAGVHQYTESACRCLMLLAGRHQLHFLLQQAGAVEVLQVNAKPSAPSMFPQYFLNECQAQCSLNVPGMFPESSRIAKPNAKPNVPSMFQECSWNAP
jgi:hypothetical protein